MNVFISSSESDLDFADRLVEHFKSLGFSVFRAPGSIATGTRDFHHEILKGISDAEIFIPVITQEFKKSDYCDQECGIAFVMNKIIFPIIVENSDSSAPKIPYGFLKYFHKITVGPATDRMAPEFKKFLLDLMKAYPYLKRPIIYQVLEVLENSGSWVQTGNLLFLLAEMGNDLNETDKIRIVRAAISPPTVPDFVSTYQALDRCFVSIFNSDYSFLDIDTRKKLFENYPLLRYGSRS